MTPRPSQVEYLEAIADEGQITRAARRLGVGQAALSQAIAHLETELGVELLERRPRGVTLTDAAEAFMTRARAAVAAESDAVSAARALGRAERGTLAVGFIGPPPSISSPALFAAFAEAAPLAELAVQDLPFPTGTTSNWLADVDVALCHEPRAEAGIGMLAIAVQPRALVVGREHRLAARGEAPVEDVLEDTYVGYHPDVQSEWAGFHSLDDHRGGPPPATTGDHVLTTLQMLGVMAASRGVTCVPRSDAELACQALPSISSVTLTDAAPARVSLVWRLDSAHPLVATLLDCAGEVCRDADGA